MNSTSEDGAADFSRLPLTEYETVFAKAPDPYLVVDPSFTIVAVNDAYCAATMTSRDAIVGRHLFEVFPDNPDDSNADGVEQLRASLLKVLKTRRPDRMLIQHYDVRREGAGGFEERYWSPFNVPVLGADGYVKWVIHTAEDVTGLMDAGADATTAEHRLLSQLRKTQDALANERRENDRLRESLRRAGA
jgi:PAS domain S-box-containing protein